MATTASPTRKLGAIRPPRGPGRPEGARRSKVLVAVRTPGHVSHLVRAGAALARAADAELLVLHVVHVPPQLPISEAGRFLAEARPVIQAVNRMREHVLDVPVRMLRPAGRRIHEPILQAAARLDVESVVVGAPTQQPGQGQPRGHVADKILRHAACEVLAVHPHPEASHPGRVVLAVRPFNQTVQTATTAVALARDHKADLTVVTVVSDSLARATEIDARMWLARLQGALADAGAPHRRLHQEVLTANRPVRALADYLRVDDLVVVGAPTRGLLTVRSALRRLPDGLLCAVPTTTVVHQPPKPTPRRWLQQLLYGHRHDAGSGR